MSENESKLIDAIHALVASMNHYKNGWSDDQWTAGEVAARQQAARQKARDAVESITGATLASAQPFGAR